MKVALLHDYLNQYGGAERVLTQLLKIFPQASVHTLLHDPERVGSDLAERVFLRRGRASALDLSWIRTHHRLFIPLMPSVAERMPLATDLDLLVSDSAGFAKGIGARAIARLGRKPFHVLYCHTPLRYAWEARSYFANRFFTGVFAPAFNFLREWDLAMAQRPNVILANSNFIAGKIQNYYRREAVTLYPPYDPERFYFDSTATRGDYFLAAGRLLAYKRFDLVLRAFELLPFPLVIAGAGPELGALRKLAYKNSRVSFAVSPTDNELRGLYAGARGLIFPNVEDFGLIPVEAHACGTPVLAFAGGGALETVIPELNGLFFKEQTAKSLAQAVRDLALIDFSAKEIARTANRFTPERFRAEFTARLPRDLRSN